MIIICASIAGDSGSVLPYMLFIGIFIGWLLTFPTNIIIYNLTDLPDVAKLNPLHALILIVISMTLTVIGGFIPAKMASRKDPVIALRSE